MNITLAQYEVILDDIHRKMNISNIFELKSHLESIETMINNIQEVSCKMAKIYNMYIDRIIDNRAVSIQTKLNNELVVKHNRDYVNIDIKRGKKKHIHEPKLTIVAPGVQVNAMHVDTLEHVPNTNLYYVDDIRQFVVKINNVCFRGNIGSIFKKSKDAHGIKSCKYSKCNKKKRRCKYYHDPIDNFANSSICSKQPQIKNFVNSEWLYTSEPINRKNIYMRHIGNRNSLSNDIEVIKLDINHKNEEDNPVSRFLNQVTHDILVMIAIGDNIPDGIIK